ncbi:MAG: hypothetical protein BWK73_31425 [Thiothrix lacustris]|uniref:Glycosyl transferase family 1 domain-containing protein n=1 Tax=Thiothrix lacustris TaxID=525917 RepID=A0A1Y1QIG3_9GAMM|nr:MAG: hypothetical protein BWK73_31425 [Thiothrix lacustris]
MKALHVLSGESGAVLQARGLDTYPSVYNALHVLHQNGWENHLITAVNTNGFEHLLQENHYFSAHPLQKAWQLGQVGRHFDMIILYEPRDIKLYQLAKLWGIDLKNRTQYLVHHSLEIPVYQLGNRAWKNKLHRYLYSGYSAVDKVIIQDATRHTLLKQHCPSLADRSTHYVPNAYIPAVEPIATHLRWFDTLRQNSRTLVSYIGAIESWALSETLFQAIADKTDITFLFSGWSSDGFAETVMARYAHCSHIHFSMGKKSLADLNYIVKHTDIGLVFYDSTDPNINEIGLSSGKLHKYLSFAKPVITNNVASLREFLHSHQLGLAVPPEQFGTAIATLVTRQAEYSRHIDQHYPTLINFEQSYQQFLETLQHSANTSKLTRIRSIPPSLFSAF